MSSDIHLLRDAGIIFCKYRNHTKHGFVCFDFFHNSPVIFDIDNFADNSFKSQIRESIRGKFICYVMLV